MMNSLFKVRKAKVSGLPVSLPNMSLFGNDVRQHKVVYTDTPHIYEDKNDINIPTWLTTSNEMDRQFVVQAGIFAKILYRGMKFLRKNPEILYIAQMLNGYKYAVIRVKNTLEKMGGYTRYNKLKNKVEKYAMDYDCSDKEAEDKVIGKNELYFYNLYKQFGGWGNKIGVYPDTTDVELKIYRAVRELYQHKSLEKFYFKLLKDLALYNLSIGRYDLIDKSKLENIVRSLLSYDIPVDVADDDVRYIHNVIGKVKDTVQETMRYVSRYSTTDWVYRYDKEVGHTRSYQVKLSSKQLRYRLNRTYKFLMGTASWWGERNMRYVRTTVLPSEEYKPTAKEVEANPDGLVLPPQLSDELADKIMEDADKKYERNFKHFVDHNTNEGGVHGIAKLNRFSPNKKIHKAIRELRKRNHDSGVVPKNMHRLTTDRKVFQSRKTVAGGSMMIDCSGSMGFSSEDIEEVVNLLPASWIAGYVGYGYEDNGYDGEVHIIADNGNMDTNAIDKLTDYGNNSIDFEALKLLAEKPEPRIWVSDQQVIGVGSSGSRRVQTLAKDKLKEIERFVLLNNIIPIEDIEMVKQVAKELSVKR